MPYISHMQNLPLHVYTALQNHPEPARLLQSFQRYLGSTFKRTPAQADSIILDGQSTLKIYTATRPEQESLCLIPSVINGAEIFDLTAEYSFIRFMQSQGVTVYLLDWGDLSQEGTLSLSSLIDQKLGKFWRCVQGYAKSPPHILGYCLGGTLLGSFLAKLKTQQSVILPQSVTFLATPFDFKADGVSWNQVITDPEKIKREIRLQNGLNQRMLQSYFLHLNPAFTGQKFLNFLNTKPGSAEEHRFVAVERWLNEGYDLPAQVSLDIIERYFVGNDALMEIQNLTAQPICMITSTKDQIVALGSSNVIKNHASVLTHIETHCGHVGMMAGTRAADSVWQPFRQFLNTVASQQR